jgi:bacterioferritin
MKGDTEVIATLNDVLAAELTAINQYFLHAKMCENWGYRRLAQHTRQESLEEMKHADSVIERILFLDGLPNMQRMLPIRVGEDVPEQLTLDLAVEVEAVSRLNKAIALCSAKSDNGSRDLLERILAEEEEAIDWLEAQLGIIKEIGKENYLAQQIHGASA